MKVSIFQPDARPLELGTRLQTLDTALQENKSQKPDLVLCPELFVSGYGNGDNIRQGLNEAHGLTSDFFIRFVKHV